MYLESAYRENYAVSKIKVKVTDQNNQNYQMIQMINMNFVFMYTFAGFQTIIIKKYEKFWTFWILEILKISHISLNFPRCL